jgi:hypothetical protein
MTMATLIGTLSGAFVGVIFVYTLTWFLFRSRR